MLFSVFIELDIYNKRQIEIDQLSMEKEDLNEKLRQLQEKSHSKRFKYHIYPKQSYTLLPYQTFPNV